MFTSKTTGTRRVLALALVLCMIVGMFTMAAGAEEAAVFTATATESVEVTAAGYYPVTVTLRNPTDVDYTVTLDQISGAALTYMGNTEENGTVSVPAYTQQVVSGYLTYAATGTSTDDVVLEVAADDVLATVTINVTVDIPAEPYVMRALTWDFNNGTQGWEGAHATTSGDDLYIATNGGSSFDTAMTTYNKPLALVPGNLYRLTFDARAWDYVNAGFARFGMYVVVTDYNADGEVLGTSLFDLAVLTLDGMTSHEFRFVASDDADYAYSKLSVNPYTTNDNYGDLRCQVTVDDVVLVDCGAAEEIEVPNGDFETFDASAEMNMFSGWTTVTMAMQGTTAPGHYGNYAEPYEGDEMMALHPATEPYYNDTGFTVGDEITVAGKIRYLQGNEQNPSFDVYVTEYDAEGNAIASQIATTYFATTKWMGFQTTFTKSAESAYFRVGIWFHTAWAGGYIDDVTMFKSGAASDVTAEDIAAAKSIQIYGEVEGGDDEGGEAPADDIRALSVATTSGWTGNAVTTTGDDLYIAINGGSAIADGLATYNTPLKLVPGNLYSLTINAQAHDVWGTAHPGVYVIVTDYNADDEVLGTSLYDLAQLTYTENTENEFRFVASDDADYAYSKLSLDAYSTNGNYSNSQCQVTVDALTLVDCGAAEMIEVPNGDFETFDAAAESNHFPGWTTVTMAMQGTTAPGHYGNYSEPYEGNEMMALHPASEPYYNDTGFTAAEEVTVTGKIRYLQGNEQDPSFDVYVTEYDATGTPINSQIATTYFSTTEWMGFQTTFTKSAESAYYRVGIWFHTAWAGGYIDDVKMFKSGAASAVTAEDIAAAAPIEKYIEVANVKAATWDFDDGLEGWTGGAAVVADNQTMYIALNGGIVYADRADCKATADDDLALVPGHLYRLSFRAKGANVLSLSNIGVYATVTDYAEDGTALAQPTSLHDLALLTDATEDFEHYEFRFVASDDAEYAYSKLSFDSYATNGNYGDLRCQVAIDDVVLVDCGVAPTEIEVPNGDFETVDEGGIASAGQGFPGWTTLTMEDKGSTKAGFFGDFASPYEGEEMMHLYPATEPYYNDTPFTTSDEVTISGKINYLLGNVTQPRFELHVTEYNAAGEKIGDSLVDTTYFGTRGWVTFETTYQKSAAAAYFKVGIWFKTVWVGSYIDDVTMYVTDTASAVTWQDVLDAEPIDGFTGTIAISDALLNPPVDEPDVPVDPEDPDVPVEPEVPVIPELSAPEGSDLERPEPPVEIDATFNDTGRSLELEGIVYINHYTQISGLGESDYVEENGGLLIWKNAVTEEEATFENAEDVNPGLVYDPGYNEYLARTDGIPTKEFADQLYLRTYVLGADGNYYYGDLMPYSVKEYCEGRINKSTNAKMKALAAQMLHYGAAAQNYFDYNLDNLANADITTAAETFDAALIDALVPYTSAPEYTVDANVQDNGKALTLVGAILVDFYFKAPTTYTDGVLQVWSNTTDLTEENFYEVPMEYDSKAKEWHGQTDGIFAKYYGKTIYARAKFTNADGAACYGSIVSYSVEEYCIGRINKSTNAEMVELAKRLVIYGERARAYFGA